MKPTVTMLLSDYESMLADKNFLDSENIELKAAIKEMYGKESNEFLKEYERILTAKNKAWISEQALKGFL